MIYSYKCSSCSHQFDGWLPMSDHDKPTHEPCPACGEKTVVRLFKPVIVGVEKRPRADSGFRDTMKAIKKANGGSKTNIPDY